MKQNTATKRREVPQEPLRCAGMCFLWLWQDILGKEKVYLAYLSRSRSAAEGKKCRVSNRSCGERCFPLPHSGSCSVAVMHSPGLLLKNNFHCQPRPSHRHSQAEANLVWAMPQTRLPQMPVGSNKPKGPKDTAYLVIFCNIIKCAAHYRSGK